MWDVAYHNVLYISIMHNITIITKKKPDWIFLLCVIKRPVLCYTEKRIFHKACSKMNRCHFKNVKKSILYSNLCTGVRHKTLKTDTITEGASKLDQSRLWEEIMIGQNSLWRRCEWDYKPVLHTFLLHNAGSLDTVCCTNALFTFKEIAESKNNPNISTFLQSL